MKILLFDMDGVLLGAVGYHRALIDTVGLVGGALGYPDATLTAEDIAAFEAAGLSSEWHSSAACAALMLVDRWQRDPDFAYPTRLPRQGPKSGDLQAPDFGTFARSLGKAALQEVPLGLRVEKIILDGRERLSARQTRMVRNLLANAADPQSSLTHRTFQELVLGSQAYMEFYAYPAVLDTDSYLLRYDQPTLSPAQRQKLLQWLKVDHHRAAILTLRPSQAPGDAFSTPEAEMGAQRAGFEAAPIAGYGGLLWLAKERQLGPESLAKPSPVHALVALRLCLGDPLEKALTASARLALDEHDDGGWQSLDGSRLYVFEDTTHGLRSLLDAGEILRKRNLALEVETYGMATNPAKRKALASAGARVLASLPEALRAIGVLE